jgi:hypothetical protein
MTSRRALLLAAGLGGALVLLWLLMRAPEPDAAQPITAARSPAASPAAPNSLPTQREPAPPRAGELSHLADRLNVADGTVREDLAVLQEVMLAFRSNFPRLGNPNGSNADITAALTGRNKLNLALIPPDHPAVNRDGELCDRWGTPFFFHAESGTRMTIRSAGPDRRMWTGDDEELAP